jgi:hypothetical protein
LVAKNERRNGSIAGVLWDRQRLGGLSNQIGKLADRAKSAAAANVSI